MKIRKWAVFALVVIVGVILYLSGAFAKITDKNDGKSPENSPTATVEPTKAGDADNTKEPTKEAEPTKEGEPTKSANSGDTTPPVISGMVGEGSYFGDSVFMVVYPDKEYDFSEYVKVKDDSGEEVKLDVNTDQVDYTKEGVYEVTFTATDSSGNTSEAVAKVEVRLPKKIDQMADELLSEIVNDSMSDEEKAKAIYVYIRKNIAYVDNYDETDWEKAAEYGMKYNGGDCFAYYSVSKVLLTRAGIPNLMVTRYKGEGHHWWNLVFVDGGWYHFDSTPRSKQATFCLVTSKQLEEYSKKAGNTHIWDVPKYPKTATKAISEVKMGARY